MRRAAFYTWRENVKEAIKQKNHLKHLKWKAVAVTYYDGSVLRHAWNEWLWHYYTQMMQNSLEAMVIIT